MKKLSEFVNKLPKNQYGVYKLFDCNKSLIYVGKSYNLKQRILTSSRYKIEARYIEVCLLFSKEDTNNLEFSLIKDNDLKKCNLTPKDIKVSKYVNVEDFTFEEKMVIDIEQVSLYCSFELIKGFGDSKIKQFCNKGYIAGKEKYTENITIDEIIYK